MSRFWSSHRPCIVCVTTRPIGTANDVAPSGSLLTPSANAFNDALKPSEADERNWTYGNEDHQLARDLFREGASSEFGQVGTQTSSNDRSQVRTRWRMETQHTLHFQHMCVFRAPTPVREQNGPSPGAAHALLSRTSLGSSCFPTSNRACSPFSSAKSYRFDRLSIEMGALHPPPPLGDAPVAKSRSLGSARRFASSNGPSSVMSRSSSSTAPCTLQFLRGGEHSCCNVRDGKVSKRLASERERKACPSKRRCTMVWFTLAVASRQWYPTAITIAAEGNRQPPGHH